jgi:hypothetical protein
MFFGRNGQISGSMDAASTVNLGQNNFCAAGAGFQFLYI